MFKFTDYIVEIFTVSKKQDVTIDVAFGKFLADVRAGKSLPYNTGDSLPGFDFAYAHEQFEALTKEQQQAAINEYSEYVHEHYTELCNLFNEL